MGRTRAGQRKLKPGVSGVAGAGVPGAGDYGAQLLASLGVQLLDYLPIVDEHPALTFANSGLLALCGHVDRPPLLCPLPLATAADGALAALQCLAPAGALAGLRGSRLLTERATLAGLGRNGRVSPGGACHLLSAADGWIAVNLPRADDWALLPAWLEVDVEVDQARLAAAVAQRAVHDLVERAAWLGLAVADAQPESAAGQWCEVVAGRPFPPLKAAPLSGALTPRPRVVDLSALWAGPLCGHLLQRCGADVVKLESHRRLDGARHGDATFFDRLNAGKRSVALDLDTNEGRETLRALLLRADIVIEASRPRALRQLGIAVEEMLGQNPRLSWIGLSGYGRGGAQENRVAFGDDAGVAAGLARVMHTVWGEYLFVGDAIADPLAGLHAALAAWASWRSGGGRLISLALKDVVSHAAGLNAPLDKTVLRQRARAWGRVLDDARVVVDQLPVPRPLAGQAAPLGADTAAVLADWGITC